MILDFFQSEGKIPVEREELKIRERGCPKSNSWTTSPWAFRLAIIRGVKPLFLARLGSAPY